MTYSKIVCIAGNATDYWNTQVYDFDTVKQPGGAATIGTSKVTMAMTRAVPTNLREDRAVFSYWIAKKVAGNLYAPVPAAELTALDAEVATHATALATKMHSDWKFVEFAYHQYDQNSPLSVNKDNVAVGQKSGPAVKVSTVNIPGTAGTTRAADQVAATCTLRTASRKHWGRVYIGGQTAGNFQTTFGRFNQTYYDALANQHDAFLTRVQSLNCELGVWCQLHPAFLTVKAFRADDVPDVQRRRRAKQVGGFKLVGLT